MRIIAPRMTGEGQASQGFTDQNGAGIVASALRNEPFVVDIDDTHLHLLVAAGVRVTLVRTGSDEYQVRVEKFKVDLNDDDDYLDDLDDSLDEDELWDRAFQDAYDDDFDEDDFII